MLDALTIAGSALTAQSLDVGVIAGNVANATTPGYQAKQAVFVPMNPGVSADVIDTGQSVDIAAEMVNLITARAAYQAAVSVIETADRMSNRLLAAV